MLDGESWAVYIIKVESRLMRVDAGWSGLSYLPNRILDKGWIPLEPRIGRYVILMRGELSRSTAVASKKTAKTEWEWNSQGWNRSYCTSFIDVGWCKLTQSWCFLNLGSPKWWLFRCQGCFSLGRMTRGTPWATPMSMCQLPPMLTVSPCLAVDEFRLRCSLRILLVSLIRNDILTYFWIISN